LFASFGLHAALLFFDENSVRFASSGDNSEMPNWLNSAHDPRPAFLFANDGHA
jgi:hypothetical protein